uniref:Uncharacterized protein n=1 Tax=Schistocephalus solidus TaxID=70667 RepID=A0A0X3Q739_SCHSO
MGDVGDIVLEGLGSISTVCPAIKSSLHTLEKTAENILMSESFEELATECRKFLDELTSSPNKCRGTGPCVQPLAKILFTFQSEAIQLLSWLKLVLQSTRPINDNHISVSNMLRLREHLDGYRSREPTFHRIHAVSDQLLLVIRPNRALSVSLPLEARDRVCSSNRINCRSDMGRNFARLLDELDERWIKVGRYLRRYEAMLQPKKILCKLQEETISLASLTSKSYQGTFNLVAYATMTTASSAALVASLKMEHSRLKRLSRRLSQAMNLLNLVDGGIVLNPNLLPPRRPPVTLPRGVPILSIEEARNAGRLRDQLTQLATTVHATWLQQLELREILKARVDQQRAVPVSTVVMPPGERSTSCSLFDGRGDEDTAKTKASPSPTQPTQLVPTPTPPSATSVRSVGAGSRWRRSSDNFGYGAFESGFVSDSENMVTVKTAVCTRGHHSGSTLGRMRTHSFPSTLLATHPITATTAKPKCTVANSPERTLKCTRLIGSRCSGASCAATIQSRLSTLCSPRFLSPESPLPRSPARQIFTGNANNNVNLATPVDQPSVDYCPPPQSPVRPGNQELALVGHLDQPLPPPQFTSSPARRSASEALSLILDEVGSRGGVGLADRQHAVPASPPFSVKYAWETTFSLLSQEVDEDEEDSAVVSPRAFSPPSTSSQLFEHGGESDQFLSKKDRRMSKSLPNFSQLY